MEVKVIKLPELSRECSFDILYSIGCRNIYSIYKLNDEELSFKYEKPLRLPLKRYIVTCGDGSIYIRCNGNDEHQMHKFIKRTIFVSSYYDKKGVVLPVGTFDTEQGCLEWIMQREISIATLRAERFNNMIQEIKDLGIGDVPEEYTCGYTEEELKEIRGRYTYYKDLNDSKKNEIVEV